MFGGGYPGQVALGEQRLVAVTATTTGIGKIQLGPLNTPQAGTQTLRIRARASSGSGVLRTWLYDSDGTTIRGGPTDFTLTGSFQTFSLNPSGITDYSALVVAFEGRNEAGGALTVEVSWIELQVPIATGAAPVVIPLAASAAVSTTSAAVRAQTKVPLAASAAVSTTTLALTAKTVISLGVSAAASITALSVWTPISRTVTAPVAAASASFPTPAVRLILLPSAASATASGPTLTLRGVARRADMPTTLELAPNTTSLEFVEGTTLELARETGLALFDLTANLEVADRATVLALREGNEGTLFLLDTALELDDGLVDLELAEPDRELVLNG